MTDKLIIFDTTLRDGEQSPGARPMPADDAPIPPRPIERPGRRFIQ